jgi:protein-tyrosine kinase
MSLVEKALQKAKTVRETAGEAVALEVAAAPKAERPAVPAAAIADGALPPMSPKQRIRIDRAALQAEGVLPGDADARAITNEYRVIKRRLLRDAADTPSDEIPGRLLTVASALPGDGKTFTCMNLTYSLAAERDTEVLLIDGDIAKPQLSRCLGLTDAPGLLDLLRDPSLPLDSCAVATDQPGVMFLPAGKWSEDASELVASERMRALMEEICQREPRRVVIVDSPPVLATPDARVLAGLVGQVLLVVRSAGTPRSAVKQAYAALQESNGRISVVLNQLDTRSKLSRLYGYDYGFGYGYGAYGAEARKGPEEKP